MEINEISEEIFLTHKDVTNFLARGIVQNINLKTSFEIEAKIKAFKGSSQHWISKQQFENAENEVRKNQSSDADDVISSRNEVDKQPTLNSQQHLPECQSQSIQQFHLMSFSFESGHRLTFDVAKKLFYLELKEINNDQNTLKVVSENVLLNISRKKETLLSQQNLVKHYLQKLKNNEYETVRIKARRTYTKDFMQRCFSKVIQISNLYLPNRSNLSPRQILQQTILVQIYCFIENYFANSKDTSSINNIFQTCFQKNNQILINYEIEVEIVQLAQYFTDIVKTQNKDALCQQISLFYQTINQIVTSFKIITSSSPSS